MSSRISHHSGVFSVFSIRRAGLLWVHESPTRNTHHVQMARNDPSSSCLTTGPNDRLSRQFDLFMCPPAFRFSPRLSCDSCHCCGALKGFDDVVSRALVLIVPAGAADRRREVLGHALAPQIAIEGA